MFGRGRMLGFTFVFEQLRLKTGSFDPVGDAVDPNLTFELVAAAFPTARSAALSTISFDQAAAFQNR